MFTIICLTLMMFKVAAQELYPLSEPASTMPKGVIGLRAFSETYKEVKQWRHMSALRLMYGVTPKLSSYVTFITSNHHGDKMPSDFPFHNAPERGKFYPYKFHAVHFYSKYRFATWDDQNQHLRIAAYMEGTIAKTTHHETEADLLMGDNSGIGGGVITTYLKKRLAISTTLGFIKPFKTINVTPDPYEGLPDIPIKMRYGNGLLYSASFGYLVYPKAYNNYEQTNINFYLEFKGKYFEAAKVDLFYGLENEYYVHNMMYPKALRKGYFVDVSPGVQFIVKSNLRIDLSATFQISGQSYARLYPLYNFGIQRFFFR